MVMHDHVDTSPHTKLKSCQNMFATSMNIYLHYNLCFVTTDVAGTQVVLTLSHSDTNRSLLNSVLSAKMFRFMDEVCSPYSMIFFQHCINTFIRC